MTTLFSELQGAIKEYIKAQPVIEYKRANINGQPSVTMANEFNRFITRSYVDKRDLDRADLRSVTAWVLAYMYRYYGITLIPRDTTGWDNHYENIEFNEKLLGCDCGCCTTW